MTDPFNVQNAADLLASGALHKLPHMLGPAEKEEWAEQGATFTLLSIQIGSDNTGAYYSHTVEYDGDTYQFRLNDDATRGPITNSLITALENGPIAGLCLRKLSERQGNAYLVVAVA